MNATEQAIIEVKMLQYQQNFPPRSNLFPKFGDMVIVAVEAAGFNYMPAIAYGEVIEIKAEDDILSIRSHEKIGDWEPHCDNTKTDILWVARFEVVEIIKA